MKAIALIFLFNVAILYSSVNAQSYPAIKVTVDKNTGEYSVSAASMHWYFKGTVSHALHNIQTIQANDSIGSYTETSFEWETTIPYKARIKWYKKTPVLLFSLTLPKGSLIAPPPFPSFTSFPLLMHTFSFNDDNFAPPQFKLNQTSTPWLFFNDSLQSYIISPASDFIIAKMMGDNKSNISSSLNEEVKNLPDNFTHSTLLVISNGIQHTWAVWGNALRKIYNRARPANDADIVLKYFGYWTDNGADYYYNYDTAKGYAPTLLSLKDQYKKENIPLGYLQLDSWWYEKSIYDYNGKPVADHKNPKLPYGKWNRYGGLLSYTADSFLFPKGLSDFHQQLKLPLVTHNRWVDPSSPYHTNYNISGFAAVDAAYWAHIIQPISKAGVVCYEQDWLNYIYTKSPDMASNVSIGNAFTDDMAKACSDANITMQYCMAMPRHFLQGVKYNNLTTIRTSEDRFNPENWKPFLYTSQLAYEIGAWPWCDVFKSSETGNMILSVLSAGPVGTGDAIGKENSNNILKACRPDGVLVKPDAPALPLDNDYLNEVNGKKQPMLAYTFTKHSAVTTGYVYALSYLKNEDRNINFKPADVGIKGNVVIFDPLTNKIQLLHANDIFKDQLNDSLYTYYILAPVTSSGIAFLGDANKIAATGKKRIAEIKAEKNYLAITVLFAKGELPVTLQGYSEKPVVADEGAVSFNPQTHLFTIILPSGNNDKVTIHLKQSNL